MSIFGNLGPFGVGHFEFCDNAVANCFVQRWDEPPDDGDDGE